MFDYISDPKEIYRRSFQIVRQLAVFDGMSEGEEQVATRLVHACGMPDIVKDLKFSSGSINAGRNSLKNGKSIFVDSEMVLAGIQRDTLVNNNSLICTLNDQQTFEDARIKGLTRSAAAVDYWQKDLDGAIVAIGNAPTALFRLLEMINRGGAKPSLILAFPVGFIGAEEAKEAVLLHSCEVPYITLLGRRGGSAMAAAAVNALSRMS